MHLTVIALLIGSMTLTSYRSVPQQTDETPFHTSIGERVSVRGCAVSRDLLKRWGGPLNYGDLIYIEGTGYRFVNDCMAARHKRAVDVWVETYKDEKEFGVRKGQIWLIHSLPQEETSETRTKNK